MQAQLLELKSKDFENNFKLDSLKKKLLKAQDSNKALIEQLQNSKS
jgi:hypothetical protein